MSGKGIEPDPEKVRAVAQWPTPQSVTEVGAFVALVTYYRQHIQSFAEIARPLHELTRRTRDSFKKNLRRELLESSRRHY